MCLQDKARNWLLNQPGGSLPTWDSLYKAFVNKFYPPERTQHLRTQIMQFQKMYDETFYEARERFLQLLSQCPHHRIDEMNLCIRFYEGLNWECQNMVDMTCKNSLMEAFSDELNGIFDRLAAQQCLSSRVREINQGE